MAGDTETQADVKPEIKTDPANKTSETIQITVKGAEGEVAFKVKLSTKFSRIMEAYCKNKSLDMKAVKFLSPEGVRMHDGDMTLAEYDIEADDCIEVVLTQVGGR